MAVDDVQDDRSQEDQPTLATAAANSKSKS
jgi:hypothetical protein